MSGLNASLGYFIAIVAFGISSRVLLRRRPRLDFLLELAASFVLAACLLEVQTIGRSRHNTGTSAPSNPTFTHESCLSTFLLLSHMECAAARAH